MEEYFKFLEANSALTQLARGLRSGREGQIVRLSGRTGNLPEDFREAARESSMSATITTVHDNYFMFIKLNFKVPVSPTNRDEVAKAELELRKRQSRAVELFRKYIPGCDKAFITGNSPSLNIRRGRVISCDYDLSLSDVIEGRHFEDNVFVYGFHGSAPRYQIKNGVTHGIPYRALIVKKLDNLLVAGMMMTSNHDAHMSTRNTVCCMGQGQAARTAAA
jgi:hypothetical protein